MPRLLTLGASLLAAAAVGAASYAALSSGGTKTVVRQVTVAGTQPAAATSSLSVTDVYERASKGVVEITVTATSSGYPFGGSKTQQAQGSGFVYNDSGTSSPTSTLSRAPTRTPSSSGTARRSRRSSSARTRRPTWRC